jgi:hypothetical protein
MKTTVLLIIIFLLVSCTGNKENPVVIEIIDTLTTSVTLERYDSEKKLNLEKKLKDNKVRKSFSDTILSIEYSTFIGQPVGNLIESFGQPLGFYYSGDPYGQLGSCYFKYCDSIQLRIAPDSLIYLKSYNSENNWNIDTFMNERIKSISIIKGMDVLLYVDQ